MKIRPCSSTWISSSAVSFSPAPASSPVSTFSQTVTESRSPALIMSAATTPAPRKSAPKPSGSSNCAACAISGLTSTMRMSFSSSRSPARISRAVGPDRGSVQPAAARQSARAANRGKAGVRRSCIEGLMY
jgi:hypothetical protein